MLMGKVLDSTTETICELHRSPYVFHLTGSRYFGTETPNSDWDFFTSANESVVRWLDEMGFLHITETMYDDYNTAMVLRKGNVDIQLQKDAELKRIVQEYIKESELLGVYLREFTHLNSARKSYAKRIWNLAYQHFDCDHA